MKIKVAIASFAVAAVVVAAFAFKAPQATNTKLVGQWFEYIGPQSLGNYASMTDARTRSNYQFSSSAIPTTGSQYLKAIFVQQSEIDDNGTPGDLTDDMPKVDLSSTDAYAALGLAKDINGEWNDLTHNTATVDANDQP